LPINSEQLKQTRHRRVLIKLTSHYTACSDTNNSVKSVFFYCGLYFYNRCLNSDNELKDSKVTHKTVHYTLLLWLSLWLLLLHTD